MSASAKEFRTWNATILGASALAGVDPPASLRGTERLFKAAVSRVAEYLGNTPAIARGSYVDPRVFERYRAGWSIRPEVARVGLALEAQPPTARRPVETAVLDLIQQRWASANVIRVAR